MVDRIRNNFSGVVGAYVKYRRGYTAEVYEVMYAFCPDINSRVLDVGCGTGIVTNELAGHYAHVTGIDIAEKMLEVARINKLDNVDLLAASAENLPFFDASFDLVTASVAYHWFNYDKAGKEIVRVLKPQGKLCVISKYIPESLAAGAPGYLPLFALENLEKFVPEVPHTNKEKIGEPIFTRVGFTQVSSRKVEIDDVYTKEEILGFIQSHSTFNLLTSEQQEEYKKLNEKSVDQHLVDGKYTIKACVEMWLCNK